jgi:hypothetical protein
VQDSSESPNILIKSAAYTSRGQALITTPIDWTERGERRNEGHLDREFYFRTEVVKKNLTAFVILEFSQYFIPE